MRLNWEVAGVDQGQMIEVATCVANGREWRRVHDSAASVAREGTLYSGRKAWTNDSYVSMKETDLPSDLQGVIGKVA